MIKKRLVEWCDLYFSFNGRIGRSTFWCAVLCLWAVFIALFNLLESTAGHASTLILYVPFFWATFALSAKRYHDLGKSGYWQFLFLIPLIGVMWVWGELGFRKSIKQEAT